MSFFDAVTSGDYALVETALKTDGAFADAEDGGVSALMMALYYRQDTIAHLIRSYRSSVTIFEAAALGEIESLEGLLIKDKSLALAQSSDGFTALGLASYFGHQQCVEALLAAGAEINRKSQGMIQAAPLHSALANGFVQIARLLIERGADVNLVADGGWVPLHYAADLGDADLATYLVSQGADREQRNEDGMTPAELGRHVGHDNVSLVLEA